MKGFFLPRFDWPPCTFARSSRRNGSLKNMLVHECLHGFGTRWLGKSHIKRLDYLFFTLSVERKLSKTLSRTSYLDRTITTTQIYRPLWYRTFTSGLAFSSQQKFLNNSQTIPAYLERKLWQHVLSGGLHSNYIVWKKMSAPKPTNYRADIISQRHTLDDKHGSDCFQGALIR